jgi:Flp pilus assembly protein TadG
MQMRQSIIRNVRWKVRQEGVILPLAAIGLLAMLAVAGLALDSSHALANKTRLQNTVDAAALAAAKAYDQSNDISIGDAAAFSLFGLNADGTGNHEMDAAYDSGEINIVIQWSETLNPFISTGIGPYVRVIATDFTLQATLSAVLGVTDIDIAATAVAGPSPTINSACNIAPMVVCAKDADDPNLFGFEENGLEVLKSGAGDGSEIGPGNFQLIRIDCPGGDCVRDNLAGSYGGCVGEGTSLETEPGNTVGPTVQGLNTRFGVYSGPVSSEDYPPDVVVTQPNPRLNYDDESAQVMQNGAATDDQTIDYGWDQYVQDITNNYLDYPPPIGVYERRVMALPVARCDGASSGSTTLEVVGFGCYFMLQQVKQQGTEAQIFGQFLTGCRAGGAPGPNPVSGPAPYIIQLYKDPDSRDS